MCIGTVYTSAPSSPTRTRDRSPSRLSSSSTSLLTGTTSEMSYSVPLTWLQVCQGPEESSGSSSPSSLSWSSSDGW